MRKVFGFFVNVLFLAIWLLWIAATYSRHKEILGTVSVGIETFHLAAWLLYVAGMVPFAVILGSLPFAKPASGDSRAMVIAVLLPFWPILILGWFGAIIYGFSILQPTWKGKWKVFWALLTLSRLPHLEEK